MILERNETYTINYTDSKGKTTKRDIVALTESPKNIKAIDITELEPLSRLFLSNKQQEYREYVDQFMANLLKFDAWYEHVHNEKLPEECNKIRTFTVEKIELVTENKDK